MPPVTTTYSFPVLSDRLGTLDPQHDSLKQLKLPAGQIFVEVYARLGRNLATRLALINDLRIGLKCSLSHPILQMEMMDICETSDLLTGQTPHGLAVSGMRSEIRCLGIRQDVEFAGTLSTSPAAYRDVMMVSMVASSSFTLAISCRPMLMKEK